MELEKKYRALFFLIGYILLVSVYNLYLNRFATEQAEYRIQEILLNTKAYAKFISEEQKPVIYELKKKGILDKGYFHPALLSTNYITRVANKYYNEELKSQDLKEIIFRQASINPLNPDNKANEFERVLIEKFNRNEISEYKEIKTIEGKKYLYYALPFKKVTQTCMKCHESPQNSPTGLVKKYGKDSGYNYRLGEINAANSITTSIEDEIDDAHYYLVVLSFITLVIFILGYILLEKMIQHLAHVKSVKEYSQELEQKVHERTEKLEESLDAVKQAQNRLVESEKMASLGRLVAGVAHEINTPVGVSVTAASHLRKECDAFVKLYEDKKISQDDLDAFLKITQKSTQIMLSNLERAADLINSFKNISVDQTSSNIRDINLKEYVNSILLSLHPKLKKTRHKVALECSDDLNVSIAAGALSQIITNLIENAIIHAFEGEEEGLITIKITQIKDGIELHYRDNGRGMSEEEQEKFFEPFFTTKRSSGGSGLGTHVIYNLVTQSLHGEISLASQAGEGIELRITIPLQEKNHV